jgi:FlaA1/EpsC-like NDP-sugar epimerase
MDLAVDELWVAMPSAPGMAIRDYVRRAQECGLKEIKIVPGNSALLTGKVHVGDIRDVQLEELLGRDPVQIDVGEVTNFVRGKTVLITGAAGSIGSEVCRQVARLGPSRIILMDQDESGVYDLHRELEQRAPAVVLHQVVGDVREERNVESIFSAHKPQVVFHAAAYKHVPLMEEHPDQAVKTNVFGTYLLARSARRWGAEKFVLISTDKAVNPTSVMGATKRAAEVAIRHAGAWGRTQFVAVRFGNVLGSRGSVVPVFQDQIARGGPVTVTHPDMRRYFMTIPEAVLLVLQAGAMGKNGEVLVLDMGEPVRIVDLARQLIILNGFKPDVEIPIVFTGIRPGEKLFEDILSAEEGTSATRSNRIFVAHTSTALSTEQFERELRHIERAVSEGRRDGIIEGLEELVKTYSRLGGSSSETAAVPVGVAD